jgi:membrane associated rhomboid family serine protease
VFPLRDENPTLLTPYVTVALIAVNIVVWVFVQGGGMSADLLSSTVCTYGMIPAEITGRTAGHLGVVLDPGMPACVFGGLTWQAMFSSMFMHGSWMHVIGNMWFLWLFGNNVEDSMGHIRYLVFYLICGVAAAAAHVLSAGGSPIPTVGASGAISGVMGAYLVLYPRVRIQTLFFFVFIIKIIAIPAWFVLLEWFVVQLLQGYASPSTGGGVAFWAHIGGFIAGVALIKVFVDPELMAARARLRMPAPEAPPW